MSNIAKAAKADKETDKNKDSTTFTAGEHSLFILKVTATKKVAAHNIYTLYLGDFETQEYSDGCTRLNKMLHELKKANKSKDLIICEIDSNGGYIDEGLRFMAIIKQYFDKSNITTIINAKGYSMGSHLFIIGGKRITIEDGALMLHTYVAGNYGKGINIKDYVEHTEERFNTLAKEQYVTPGYMNTTEFEDYKKGVEFWLTTKGMVKRGVATHVILRDGNTVTAKEYNKL